MSLSVLVDFIPGRREWGGGGGASCIPVKFQFPVCKNAYDEKCYFGNNKIMCLNVHVKRRIY